jgi:dienelactone hydrolase
MRLTPIALLSITAIFASACGPTPQGTGGRGGRGGSAGVGGTGQGGTGPGGTAGTGGAGDPTRPGPFATTVVSNSGPNGQYTIFRPEPLGQNGFLHPPLIWGPGILTTVSMYTAFLTRVASHGFVVVAVNSLGAGPGSPANQQPMMDGLNWIVAQNGQAGSYQGKLDVNHAVSMGYSIGGTAAVQVGAHPNVATTISIHGHSATSALHGPLFQTTGTQDTVGLPLQQQTYNASRVQTFLATVEGATHLEILSAGGGRETGPIIAWLRLFIYNDQSVRNYFYGDDCVVCRSPWTNPQRKNWQ